MAALSNAGARKTRSKPVDSLAQRRIGDPLALLEEIPREAIRRSGRRLVEQRADVARKRLALDAGGAARRTGERSRRAWILCHARPSERRGLQDARRSPGGVKRCRSSGVTVIPTARAARIGGSNTSPDVSSGPIPRVRAVTCSS